MWATIHGVVFLGGVDVNGSTERADEHGVGLSSHIHVCDSVA